MSQTSLGESLMGLYSIFCLVFFAKSILYVGLKGVSLDENESNLLMYNRVFQKTQSISDQVPLLVGSVTIISKTSPKKLDHFDEN